LWIDGATIRLWTRLGWLTGLETSDGRVQARREPDTEVGQGWPVGGWSNALPGTPDAQLDRPDLDVKEETWL